MGSRSVKLFAAKFISLRNKTINLQGKNQHIPPLPSSYFATTTGACTEAPLLTALASSAETEADLSAELTARKWYSTIKDIMRVPRKIAIELSSLSVTIL